MGMQVLSNGCAHRDRGLMKWMIISWRLGRRCLPILPGSSMCTILQLCALLMTLPSPQSMLLQHGQAPGPHSPRPSMSQCWQTMWGRQLPLNMYLEPQTRGTGLLQTPQQLRCHLRHHFGLPPRLMLHRLSVSQLCKQVMPTWLPMAALSQLCPPNQQMMAASSQQAEPIMKRQHKAGR